MTRGKTSLKSRIRERVRGRLRCARGDADAAAVRQARRLWTGGICRDARQLLLGPQGERLQRHVAADPLLLRAEEVGDARFVSARHVLKGEVDVFENLKDMLWAANPKNRIWPQNRDPHIKGPQPRILSYEAALEMRRRQREAKRNGDDVASHGACGKI